jgi:hypothetical protein
MTYKEEWYCRQKKQRPLWEAAGSYRNGTAIADCALDITLGDYDYRVLRSHNNSGK